MSILKHNTLENCPICGNADVLEESFEHLWMKSGRFHGAFRLTDNGQRYERRMLLCGYGETQTAGGEGTSRGGCSNRPEEIARRARQEEIDLQIQALHKERDNIP